jgi:anti-sigma-K factor RskA
MKSGNRELVDRLAAEYVLGTLRGQARRHFERWLVSPQVKAIVNTWEGRLAPFEPALLQVTPPPDAWQGIERRLELRRIGRRPWQRWLALGVSLLFLGAAAWVLLRWN